MSSRNLVFVMVMCHGECHAYMSWWYVMQAQVVSTRPTWHIRMTYRHDTHICHGDMSWWYVIQTDHHFLQHDLHDIYAWHTAMTYRHDTHIYHGYMSCRCVMQICNLDMPFGYVIWVCKYVIYICHVDMSSAYVIHICHLHILSGYVI